MSALNTYVSPRFKLSSATALRLVQTSGVYSINPANPATNRTLNIIDPGGTDDFVFAAAAQTLSNKLLGTLLNANSQKITNLANGTASGDAINLGQLQTSQAGLSAKTSCRAATAATLGSYTGSGTGTLTNSGVQAALVIDGVTMAVGDRFLDFSETSTKQKDNGIYVVTTVGDATHNWVVTRSADFLPGGECEGAYTFIAEGTVNKALGFILTTDMPYTINTTALTFTEFQAAGTFTAGNGINIASAIITAVGTANRISVGSGGIDIAATFVGQTSLVTLGVVTTGTWQANTIDDLYITVPYIKADGSRTLSANWGAGAHSGTFNNVVVGQSANLFNNADDANVNGTAVTAFTIRGGNKTGASASGAGALLNIFGGSANGGSSTGPGGNIILAGGTSVGGAAGKVNIADAADNTKLLAFSLSSATTAKTTTFSFSQTGNNTISFQDSSYIVIGRDTIDTLTNKTLTNPVINVRVLAKSISYTLLVSDDEVNFTTGSSALNATLPKASTVGAGKRLLVRKVDAGSGSVTIVPDATVPDTIGWSNVVVDAQFDSLMLTSDGVSQWNAC